MTRLLKAIFAIKHFLAGIFFACISVSINFVYSAPIAILATGAWASSKDIGVVIWSPPDNSMGGLTEDATKRVNYYLDWAIKAQGLNVSASAVWPNYHSPPVNSLKQFGYEIDHALHTFRHNKSPNPELYIVLLTHGRNDSEDGAPRRYRFVGGYQEDQKTRYYATDLLERVNSELTQWYRELIPIISVNFIIDTCHSGQCVLDMKSQLPASSLDRVTILSTSRPNRRSNAYDGVRLVEWATEAVAKMNELGLSFCSGCTWFQSIAMLTAVFRTTPLRNGSYFDESTNTYYMMEANRGFGPSWSSFRDLRRWTLTDVLSIGVAISEMKPDDEVNEIFRGKLREFIRRLGRPRIREEIVERYRGNEYLLRFFYEDLVMGCRASLKSKPAVPFK